MTNSESPLLSVGFILDGNRRWAKERNLPSLEGHRKGFEKVRELVGWAHERTINTVYIYAFSTENWNRAPEEVSYLMKLFAEAFTGNLVDDVLAKEGRIVFLGDRSRLPAELVSKITETEAQTKNGKGTTLAVCLSYGGRDEIIAATNTLIREGKELVDEAGFKDAMWGANLPDPDIIVRTSGEQRLSGFLTWQSVYSELFFTKTKWPDFSEKEFDEILEEYKNRERRRGK